MKDQFLAVVSSAVAGNPPLFLALDNPTAFLLATEGNTKWGEEQAQIIINHPEGLK